MAELVDDEARSEACFLLRRTRVADLLDDTALAVTDDRVLMFVRNAGCPETHWINTDHRIVISVHKGIRANRTEYRIRLRIPPPPAPVPAEDVVSLLRPLPRRLHLLAGEAEDLRVVGRDAHCPEVAV